MNIHYDREEDMLRIIFRNQPVFSGDEVAPGVHVFIDNKGEIVGLDIDDASRRVDDPGVANVTQDD
jgi:uncharacterized protein YuzE